MKSPGDFLGAGHTEGSRVPAAAANGLRATKAVEVKVKEKQAGEQRPQAVS